MNRKFVFGVISASLLAGAFVLMNDSDQVAEATYTPRDANTTVGANQGYMNYLNTLRTNTVTGQVENSDLIRGRIQAEKFQNTNTDKAISLTWEERGPDNIGGRTRTVMVVESSPNQVYAGSVSGGLWWSDVEGNYWNRVKGFNTNNAVSSIAQTNNGRIFVATGCMFDSPSDQEGSGAAGNGIWFTDELGKDASFTLVDNSQPSPQSGFNTSIQKSQWNKIVADVNVNDKLWAGGNAGLFVYENGTFAEFDRIDAATSASSTFGLVGDIEMSADGQTIVVGEHTGGVRTHISWDAGATWTLVSTSNGANNTITHGGVGRATYAISPDDKSWIYSVQVNSGSGSLKSIWHSMDGGNTWAEIGVGGNNTFDPFSFLGTTLGSQGYYDQCVTVVPGDKQTILVGGIQMWRWTQTQTNPSFGQWEQAAYQGSQCQQCVHSDLHSFTWDLNNNLYIGCDGGVYKGRVEQNLYYPANRGYNVTQFYAMAFDNHDNVMGGTQDNGTLRIDGSGMTSLEAASIRGGDGFECEMSYINSDVLFSSVYNGDIMRSDNAGGGWDYFFDDNLQNLFDAGGLGPFYTVMALWENPNDPTSQDSLIVVANQTYGVGDTITYTSASVQTSLWTIATSQVDSLDTLLLPDPVQSLFAAGLGSQGAQVTRDALRFAQQADWHQVATPSQLGNGTIHSLEFSSDGNHLFVGTFNGTVFRVDNLQMVYEDADVDSFVTVTQITSGPGVVTDIAVTPANENVVVVTYGGFSPNGARVYRSTNALSANPTFSAINGDLPTQPSYPVYGAAIDRDDEDIIIIGTEYGVYATDNGGSSWDDQNSTMELVQVFDVRQQQRSWTDGVFNPGMIYLGTHGRGFWSSASLLSTRPLEDFDFASGGFSANLQVYPNPVTDYAEIRYELGTASDVEVRVYDLEGRLIQTQRANGTKGKNVVRIDANNMTAGAYIIEFQSNRERRTGKMVVQK